MQSQLACHSPERLAGHKMEALAENEFACLPQVIVEKEVIPVRPGNNGSLTCTATGDPLPKVYWVIRGRILTNETVVWFSNPERNYLIFDGNDGNRAWSELIIRDLSKDDLSAYTCVAENTAGLVDKNVTLVLQSPNNSNEDSSNTLIFVIIAIVICIILFILLLIVCCYCCWKRKRQKQKSSKQKLKQNGSVGHHIEHKNILIVNPVEKPPRKYEKVPQTDVELNVMNDPSGHHSYDGIDYQESLAAHYHQTRSPLATLEEECDDNLTHDTTLEASLPLHTSIDQSCPFPDLLDNARLPRAVSPTQLSYHSLIYPSYNTNNTNNAEWRYSYILPGENTRYPIGYSTPQHQPTYRPGYVTLPRRPRVPSWAGATSMQLDEEGETAVVKVAPIYDKLGPRTTIDGTSKTDLTKPSTSSILNDIYSPGSPPAVNALPPHYAPINEYNPRPKGLSQHQSATLPRSTPNLLEEKGFSMPQKTALPTVAAVIHKPSNSNSIVSQSSSSPTPSSASTLRLISPAQPSSSPGGLSDTLSINDSHPGPSISPHNTSLDSSLSFTKNNNNLLNNKNIDSSPNVPLGTSTPVVTSLKKKVPPKPPPKPSLAKRLSLTSPSGDSSTRKLSMSSEGGRIYQDEGPDGTEV